MALILFHREDIAQALIYFHIISFLSKPGSHWRGAEEPRVAPELQVADPRLDTSSLLLCWICGEGHQRWSSMFAGTEHDFYGDEDLGFSEHSLCFSSFSFINLTKVLHR